MFQLNITFGIVFNNVDENGSKNHITINSDVIPRQGEYIKRGKMLYQIEKVIYNTINKNVIDIYCV